MFFHPEFVTNEWVKPLDEVIDNTIQASPIDTRRRLYNNIILSGGSTLVEGFDTRLEKGIKARVQERYDKFAKISHEKVEPITVNVQQNMAQRFAVWFGGSFLATNVIYKN